MGKQVKKEKLDWELEGGSEHISKLRDEIIYVAQKIRKYDIPVLIEGPSGTGKELIAKEICKKSGRLPFKAINCAAFLKDLFESELFGYAKGAFTGAHPNGKAGLIEETDGGILFLDEIGDLAIENQGKILRLLQEKTYKPVMATQEKSIKDIRIIAATNKNLGEQIKAERFREDLYYRLKGHKIKTIALKERLVDIIYLLNSYLGDLKLNIDPRVKTLLYSYNFPGNVRELKSLAYSADNYQYIKDTLTKSLANSIGKDAKVLIKDDTWETGRTKLNIEMNKCYKTITDAEERSRKKNQLNAVMNFFETIEMVEPNDRDWGREIQRYEILLLWGKTEYSKEDICRILGIRTNSLSPDIFKKQFDIDLPERSAFHAQMEEILDSTVALTFYPDFLQSFARYYPDLAV